MTTLEQSKPADEARDPVLRSGAVSSCNDLLEVRLSDQTSLFKDGRLLVWFSCGAASAVALKLVAHLNPLAIYCDTSANEHPDNVRFRADVERWTGIAVTVIKSTRFSTVEEVADEKQYMAGPEGAPCTVEMKKVPRFNFQRADDTHIFGFSLDEKNRLKKFEADNHDMNLAWPLVQAEMTKADCLEMIVAAGIALPVLYTLGFANNNCLGCFKATSAKYWNRTRRHFPAVFKLRCEQSRRLGVRLVRYKGVRIFLDELPEDATDNITEDLSCGPQCADARTSNDPSSPTPGVKTLENVVVFDESKDAIPAFGAALWLGDGF